MLELEAADGEGPRYWVNGLPGNRESVEKDENLIMLVNTLIPEQKNFRVHFKQINAKHWRFRIDLDGAGDAVSIEAFKGFLAVNVKAVKPENFENAVGLMGSYPTGAKVARDGTTIIDTPNLFGKEWQVSSCFKV